MYIAVIFLYPFHSPLSSLQKILQAAVGEQPHWYLTIFSDRSSLSGSIITRNSILATKFPRSARSMIFLRSYPSSTSTLSIYANFTTQCRKARTNIGSSWRICHLAPLFLYVLQDKIFNYQRIMKAYLSL